MQGSGSDIWGTADSFNMAYEPLGAYTQIVARVTSIQNTNTYAKAGVMFRDTLTAGSTDVILDLKPNGGGLEFMARSATGGTTSFIAGGAGTAPIWLKLVRSGSTFTGYSSTDGVNWTLIGSTSVTMPTNVFVGSRCAATTRAR